jgi:hypothetical protein
MCLAYPIPYNTPYLFSKKGELLFLFEQHMPPPLQAEARKEIRPICPSPDPFLYMP